jgi:hypothetical protein
MLFGLGLDIGSAGLLGRLPASAGMPAPPAGYHWEYVTYDGQQVTSNGVNVVALAPN